MLAAGDEGNCRHDDYNEELAGEQATLFSGQLI
jgi:hypothetical protein